MDLGNFYVGLAVKDLAASKTFYQAIGFEIWGDFSDQGWAILKNGETTIGLYEGMFEKNIMTFNPGWDKEAQPVDPFTDVRELQKHFKSQGLSVHTEADETSTGPAHCILEDPDGNVIMFDQHR